MNAELLVRPDLQSRSCGVPDAALLNSLGHECQARPAEDTRMCSDATRSCKNGVGTDDKAFQLRSGRLVSANCSSPTSSKQITQQACDRRDPGCAEELPPWEKVLWKRQPYPDNHTDETFLQQLVGLSCVVPSQPCSPGPCYDSAQLVRLSSSEPSSPPSSPGTPQG